MRYTTFGRNAGLRVSELVLGTGNFGTGWGYGQVKRLENVSAIDYGTPHKQIAGTLPRAQGAGTEYISIRPPRA